MANSLSNGIKLENCLCENSVHILLLTDGSYSKTVWELPVELAHSQATKHSAMYRLVWAHT
eukprot:scaffold632672_cov42-Prasinocladus_malaysianus.AAC.2